MMQNNDSSKRIFTIPNVLCVLRVLLIPLIMLLYFKGHNLWAAFVLGVSGLTDLLDGYIARRFNQISDLGKAIDPIADKLTQLATLVCVGVNFPLLLIPFVLLFIKEVTLGALSLVAMKKTHLVEGADWHGKVSSFIIYLMTTLHFLWYGVPLWLTVVTVVVSTSFILLSFVLYAMRHIRAIKSAA